MIVHGTPVNIAVTVTSSGGTPTGDVALVASGNSPAVAAVQGTSASPSILTLTNGAATNPAYAYLPGGSYSLVANYGGDGTFAPSTSTPPISVTISPEASTLGLFIQQFSATTGTGSTVTSVPYGTYVSVSAQPFSTAEVPNLSTLTYVQQATGTVTFSSSPALASLNQKATVNSNGLAEIPNQLSVAYPPGTYAVSASYSGDASFTASSAGPQSFTVTKNNVSIASATGSSGTVVVEVDPASIGNFDYNSGLLLPTGTVTLTSSSGATVGTGTLAVVNTSNGQAAQTTITVTGTPANINYAGDGNYNSGTAVIGGGGTGSFTLSGAPSTLTISSGGSGSTTMNVTPAAGFTGTVNLSCSAGSSPLSCSLAAPSVAVTGSTAVTDKLTVNSTASGALHIPANPANRWYAAGGAALAGILLIGLPGRRRAWQRMLSLMLFFIAVGVVGCGGTSSGGGGSQSYNVTVTATSGTQSQTSTVSVTVQ